jgi:hypothetical protein
MIEVGFLAGLVAGYVARILVGRHRRKVTLRLLAKRRGELQAIADHERWVRQHEQGGAGSGARR